MSEGISAGNVEGARSGFIRGAEGRAAETNDAGEQGWAGGGRQGEPQGSWKAYQVAAFTVWPSTGNDSSTLGGERSFIAMYRYTEGAVGAAAAAAAEALSCIPIDPFIY